MSPETKQAIKVRIKVELRKYRKEDWMSDELLAQDIGAKLIHLLDNDYQDNDYAKRATEH